MTVLVMDTECESEFMKGFSEGETISRNRKAQKQGDIWQKWFKKRCCEEKVLKEGRKGRIDWMGRKGDELGEDRKSVV